MNTAVIVNLLIQLVAGAAGGQGLGKILEQFNLGPIGNTIAGAIGGLAGGSWVAPMVAAGAGAGAAATGNTAMDLSAIAGSVAGGGIGGAVLTLVAGAIKKLVVGRTST